MKLSALSSILGLASAGLHAGECPKTVNTVSPFDAAAYMGTWYEAKADFFFSGPCTTATYALKSNGDVEVKNRGWFWWFFLSYFTLSGQAGCPASDAGKCWVNFDPSGSLAPTKGIANYNVLATDYTSYTFIYGCTDTFLGKYETGWILTRDKTPTEA